MKFSKIFSRFSKRQNDKERNVAFPTSANSYGQSHIRQCPSPIEQRDFTEQNVNDHYFFIVSRPPSNEQTTNDSDQVYETIEYTSSLSSHSAKISSNTNVFSKQSSKNDCPHSKNKHISKNLVTSSLSESVSTSKISASETYYDNSTDSSRAERDNNYTSYTSSALSNTSSSESSVEYNQGDYVHKKQCVKLSSNSDVNSSDTADYETNRGKGTNKSVGSFGDKSSECTKSLWDMLKSESDDSNNETKNIFVTNQTSDEKPRIALYRVFTDEALKDAVESTKTIFNLQDDVILKCSKTDSVTNAESTLWQNSIEKSIEKINSNNYDTKAPEPVKRLLFDERLKKSKTNKIIPEKKKGKSHAPGLLANQIPSEPSTNTLHKTALQKYCEKRNNANKPSECVEDTWKFPWMNQYPMGNPNLFPHNNTPHEKTQNCVSPIMQQTNNLVMEHALKIHAYQDGQKPTTIRIGKVSDVNLNETYTFDFTPSVMRISNTQHNQDTSIFNNCFATISKVSEKSGNQPGEPAEAKTSERLTETSTFCGNTYILPLAQKITGGTSSLPGINSWSSHFSELSPSCTLYGISEITSESNCGASKTTLLAKNAANSTSATAVCITNSNESANTIVLPTDNNFCDEANDVDQINCIENKDRLHVSSSILRPFHSYSNCAYNDTNKAQVCQSVSSLMQNNLVPPVRINSKTNLTNHLDKESDFERQTTGIRNKINNNAKITAFIVRKKPEKMYIDEALKTQNIDNTACQLILLNNSTDVSLNDQVEFIESLLSELNYTEKTPVVDVFGECIDCPECKNDSLSFENLGNVSEVIDSKSINNKSVIIDSYVPSDISKKKSFTIKNVSNNQPINKKQNVGSTPPFTNISFSPKTFTVAVNVQRCFEAFFTLEITGPVFSEAASIVSIKTDVCNLTTHRTLFFGNKIKIQRIITLVSLQQCKPRGWSWLSIFTTCNFVSRVIATKHCDNYSAGTSVSPPLCQQFFPMNNIKSKKINSVTINDTMSNALQLLLVRRLETNFWKIPRLRYDVVNNIRTVKIELSCLILCRWLSFVQIFIIFRSIPSLALMDCVSELMTLSRISTICFTRYSNASKTKCLTHANTLTVGKAFYLASGIVPMDNVKRTCNVHVIQLKNYFKCHSCFVALQGVTNVKETHTKKKTTATTDLDAINKQKYIKCYSAYIKNKKCKSLKTFSNKQGGMPNAFDFLPTPIQTLETSCKNRSDMSHSDIILGLNQLGGHTQFQYLNVEDSRNIISDLKIVNDTSFVNDTCPLQNKAELNVLTNGRPTKVLPVVSVSCDDDNYLSQIEDNDTHFESYVDERDEVKTLITLPSRSSLKTMSKHNSDNSSIKEDIMPAYIKTQSKHDNSLYWRQWAIARKPDTKNANRRKNAKKYRHNKTDHKTVRRIRSSNFANSMYHSSIDQVHNVDQHIKSNLKTNLRKYKSYSENAFEMFDMYSTLHGFPQNYVPFKEIPDVRCRRNCAKKPHMTGDVPFTQGSPLWNEEVDNLTNSMCAECYLFSVYDNKKCDQKVASKKTKRCAIRTQSKVKDLVTSRPIDKNNDNIRNIGKVDIDKNRGFTFMDSSIILTQSSDYEYSHKMDICKTLDDQAIKKDVFSHSSLISECLFSCYDDIPREECLSCVWNARENKYNKPLCMVTPLTTPKPRNSDKQFTNNISRKLNLQTDYVSLNTNNNAAVSHNKSYIPTCTCVCNTKKEVFLYPQKSTARNTTRHQNIHNEVIENSNNYAINQNRQQDACIRTSQIFCGPQCEHCHCKQDTATKGYKVEEAIRYTPHQAATNNSREYVTFSLNTVLKRLSSLFTNSTSTRTDNEFKSLQPDKRKHNEENSKLQNDDNAPSYKSTGVPNRNQRECKTHSSSVENCGDQEISCEHHRYLIDANSRELDENMSAAGGGNYRGLSNVEHPAILLSRYRSDISQMPVKLAKPRGYKVEDAPISSIIKTPTSNLSRFCKNTCLCSIGDDK